MLDIELYFDIAIALYATKIDVCSCAEYLYGNLYFILCEIGII